MNNVYRALADPTRRRILELLREKDITAGELAAHFDLAKPTLSRHFSVLKEADLIQGDKTGTTITYRLNVSVLEESLMALMNALKIDPEGARRWNTRKPAAEGISPRPILDSE
jgi:DNA-binding transcriptional ArsR family regulator